MSDFHNKNDFVSVCSKSCTGKEGNLISSLVQGFGKMYDLTSVTACLPFLQVTVQPLLQGIIPVNLTILEEYANISKSFVAANVSYYLDEDFKCRKFNLARRNPLQSYAKRISADR